MYTSDTHEMDPIFMRAHSVWVSSHSHAGGWLHATAVQAATVQRFASRASQFTGHGGGYSAGGRKTLGTYRNCTLLYDNNKFYVRGSQGCVRDVLIIPRAGKGSDDGIFCAIHGTNA